jgi:hypothetical protein
MKKPASLRAALTAAVPHLKRNPDALHIFLDEGRIISTAATSLSFEYQYVLNVIVTDYSEHADTIVVPILAWLRRNQIDLLLNPDRGRDGFRFEADILNHTTLDLSIKLTLTERVGVTENEGKLTVTHFDEPPLDALEGVEHWQLFVKGELVSEWSEKA